MFPIKVTIGRRGRRMQSDVRCLSLGGMHTILDLPHVAFGTDC